VIYGDLKKRYPSLSFSTVYNTLNMLEKIGEVQSLHLFDDFLNYDPDTSTHYHFICGVCNEVIDIFPGGNEKMSVPVGEIAGHRVDSAQIIFKGICKNCL
jgi:Fur family peroxide stress response transcriptional regulator